MMGSRPVLFLHLPKTGGVSLTEHMKRNLGEGLIHHQPGAWQAIERSEDLGRFDYFAGHFNYGFHRLLRRKGVPEVDQITMLRHPVERVISAYYYHGIRESWVDCLRYGRGLCREYENDMVKRLSGLAQPNGYDQDSLDRLIPYGTTEIRHLEKAKENLTRLSAIGITEHYDESIARFSRMFGWKGESIRMNSAGQRLHNRRPGWHELDFVDLDLIYERNRLDMELYEFALGLFERQQTGERSPPAADE